MKIGILGSGSIVNVFLSHMKDKDFLVLEGICGRERSKEKVENLKTKYNINKTYYDYDKMLEDEEIDTIYVALPNSLHYEASLKAIEAGKNVICEKPFTSTAKELEELINRAEKKDVFLFEAILNIYLPNYYEIKKDLEKLGNISIVNFNFSQYSSLYNAFKAGETPYVFDPLYSGGALMDINVYNLHLIVKLFGLPDDYKYYPNLKRGIDVSGIAILEYPNFIASLTAAKDSNGELRGEIQGDKGSLIMNTTSMIRDYSLNIYGEETKVKNFNTESIMVPEFRAFGKCISENNKEFCNKALEHSLNIMKLCDGLRKTGNIVFPADK